MLAAHYCHTKLFHERNNASVLVSERERGRVREGERESFISKELY